MSTAQDLEKKIKNQLEVLKRIDVYIGTTNTKCTILMSYCAAATAFIFTLLAKLDFSTVSIALMVEIGVFSVLALSLALWSMVLATITIFPVTFSRPDAYQGGSLIFYGDISSCGRAGEYSDKVNNSSDAEFLEDLNEQVYTLASIASKKFARIQFATVVLVLHFWCMAAVLIGAVIYYLF